MLNVRKSGSPIHHFTNHHSDHYVCGSRASYSKEVRVVRNKSDGESENKTASVEVVEAAVIISTSSGMDVADGSNSTTGSGGSNSWLDGKKILLTGATGYLGKVICEKLLRECVGIRKVYILVRSNENEEFHRRVAKYRDDVVFDRVKSIERSVMDKVIAIEGDLSKVNLELQDNDREKLRREVNVVIHAACNSDLYVGLKEAILTNVRGTKYVLSLAESMPNLESFVYVSHVFSNCYEKIIGERVYPARMEPNDLIRIHEERKELGIDTKIQQEFTNFYLFSHHLSECLVSRSTIPCSIARLSTLAPSLDEPYAGWIDRANHLDNLLTFIANGSVQSVYGKCETPVDILPVDVAAKGILAIAQKGSKSLGNQCSVYNLTDAGMGEISWSRLIDAHTKMAIENPLETIYWYPGGRIYSSYFLYVATFVLFQILPAIFFDFLSFLCTGKVRYVQNQIELFHQLQTVERFFHQVWMFDTENADELFNNLSFTEKLKFKFRTQHFNLEEYARNWNYGRRTYLLATDQKATRVTRWSLQAFYVFGVILKTVFALLIGYVLFRLVSIMNPSLGESECHQYEQSRGELFSTFQKI